MSTNSVIGYIDENGKSNLAYCHWDGYFSHNGINFLAMLKYELNFGELMGSIPTFRSFIDVVVNNGDYIGSFGHYQKIGDYKLGNVLDESYLGMIHVNTSRGDTLVNDYDEYGYFYVADYKNKKAILNEFEISFDDLKKLSLDNLFELVSVYIVNNMPEEDKVEFFDDDGSLDKNFVYEEFDIERFEEEYQRLVTSGMNDKEKFNEMVINHSIDILNNSYPKDDVLKKYKLI